MAYPCQYREAAGTKTRRKADEEIKERVCMPNRAKIFSFFSGSGFLDLGFETNGFDIEFVNEFSPSCQKRHLHGVTEEFLDCYMEPVVISA